MSATVVNSGIVHYEVIGRGKPLIFLHGWVGSWRYWVRTMEALSITYRAYAFDLWGFGDSDKRADYYSLDAYVELLDGFVERLGMEQVSLVGHALGGLVALRFARAAPERVGRVMGVSVPLAESALTRPVAALIGDGDSITKLLGKRVSLPELEPEVQKADTAAIHNTLRALSETDLRSDLRALELPVLLIYGRSDPLVRPPSEEYLACPSGLQRVMVMDHAQHFPMLEEHNKFNRLLQDFLEAGEDLSGLVFKDEWQRRIR